MCLRFVDYIIHKWTVDISHIAQNTCSTLRLATIFKITLLLNKYQNPELGQKIHNVYHDDFYLKVILAYGKPAIFSNTLFVDE